MTRIPRRLWLLVLAIAAILWPEWAARAHEVPVSVTVQAYVRPEGETLRFLARVPLAAMRDVNLPLREALYVVPSESDPELIRAAELWIRDYLSIYEEGHRLEGGVVAVRMATPSDRSFTSYGSAIGTVRSPPLPDGMDLPWQQALLDVLIEYPITSDASRFSIEPYLAHLGQSTTTVLRFLPADGGERVFQYSGDPGLVRLDPRWHQAALTFLELGFRHILEGIDHILFILCLVIPLRRFRPLLAVVTSFTVAHSITLVAAALGWAPRGLWFPPFIETLIALSIVYMALENIVGARAERRWMLAFGFGLVHGFGFSFLLSESLQFAGSHLVGSLFAFNVGVELGQIAALVVMVPVLSFLFRRVVAERIGVIVLSALVAHTAWHWMTERGSELLQYRFVPPVFDLALAVVAMRWMMLALIVVGAGWLLSGAIGRLVPTGETTAATGSGARSGPQGS